MTLRVEVLVVETRFVEITDSGCSLRSAQQQVSITPALVLCYHPLAARVPPRPGMPRAWLK
eukprot:3349384-Pleurochrysis_carterae.AAC.1